jgi:hypothetical protein
MDTLFAGSSTPPWWAFGLILVFLVPALIAGEFLNRKTPKWLERLRGKELLRLTLPGKTSLGEVCVVRVFRRGLALCVIGTLLVFAPLPMLKLVAGGAETVPFWLYLAFAASLSILLFAVAVALRYEKRPPSRKKVVSSVRATEPVAL